MDAAVDQPKKGIPPGKGFTGGGKKGAKTPPDILRAYRFVSRQPEGTERNHLERMVREVLKKDAGKFLATLGKLEADYQLARAQGPKPGASGEKIEKGSCGPGDEGEEKVLELVERLLEEFNREPETKGL